jgi:nucleoid-associated protein YejK
METTRWLLLLPEKFVAEKKLDNNNKKNLRQQKQSFCEIQQKQN